MQASLQKLPWSELSPASQAKIKSVSTNAPLFHRMPRQTIYADPEIYHFLIQHPDLIIGFWEQLGATQLSLREVREDRYILKETTESTAAIEVLYRSNDLCIAYAKGEYRGPLLSKAYHGEVILILRTQYTRDEANEPMVICDLDTIIQINSLGVDVLAKLFFSQITKIADSNFEITASFVSQVSKAASRNTNSLKAAVDDIDSVRREICDDFCEVIDRVAMRHARRHQPAPPAFVQQHTQSVAPKKESFQDFSISLKPPADWGMDHFFDSPQQSRYTSVRYENGGELNAPKPLGTNTGEYAVPRLPRMVKQ